MDLIQSLWDSLEDEDGLVETQSGVRCPSHMASLLSFFMRSPVSGDYYAVVSDTKQEGAVRLVQLPAGQSPFAYGNGEGLKILAVSNHQSDLRRFLTPPQQAEEAILG